jgi:hypothetical protein
VEKNDYTLTPQDLSRCVLADAAVLQLRSGTAVAATVT